MLGLRAREAFPDLLRFLPFLVFRPYRAVQFGLKHSVQNLPVDPSRWDAHAAECLAVDRQTDVLEASIILPASAPHRVMQTGDRQKEDGDGRQ